MLLAFVTCAAQNVWPTMEVSRPSQRRTSESTSLVGTKGVKGVAMQIHAGCGRKSRGSDVPWCSCSQDPCPGPKSSLNAEQTGEFVKHYVPSLVSVSGPGVFFHVPLDVPAKKLRAILWTLFEVPELKGMPARYLCDLVATFRDQLLISSVLDCPCASHSPGFYFLSEWGWRDGMIVGHGQMTLSKRYKRA